MDSEYYGLFHYRRVFDMRFSKKNIAREPIQVRFRNAGRLRNCLGLVDANLIACAQEHDIIVSTRYIDHQDIEDMRDLNLYENYAFTHYSNDLDTCIAYIKSHYPHMSDALDSALFARPRHWSIANMFIMRKDLFFEYCEWIFDVLFGVQDRIPYKSYDKYQARVFGFLAERLFNVWLEYKRVQNPELRFGYAPIIFISKKKKPIFGILTDDKYKRLYIFGIRIWKSKIKNA